MVVAIIAAFVLYYVGKQCSAYFKQRWELHKKEAERLYNQLPELGKIRVDAEVAEKKRALASIGAAAGTIVASLANPMSAMPVALNSFRFAKGVWQECDDALLDAEERRAEALGPDAVISLIRNRQRDATEKLRKTQEKLKVRARRRTRDYPILFGVIFSLITFMFFMDQPPGFKSLALGTGEILGGIWLLFTLGSLPDARRELREATTIDEKIAQVRKESDEAVDRVTRQQLAKADQVQRGKDTIPDKPPVAVDFKEFVENWSDFA